MKLKLSIISFALVLLATVGVNMNSAQQEAPQPTRAFMREKLQLAQQILEGLTTENYNLIETKATRLSAMSKGSNWRVFENPDYDQHSFTFRRHATALIKAAREHNLDAATLAYVQATMSCIDCHKFVRGKLIGDSGVRISPALTLGMP